ncbi:MAG TPA: SDR family oxidoreductase [Burkholderiales bacterium]|nr:SDR family oxidoreductase [Burkholderiales bacterium]
MTGGSRGIGRGTAALLERRGYRVAVADLDRPGGGTDTFFRCDVASETSVRACVRGVLHRFGRLDALINNAGLADPADPPVEKLTLAAWNRRLGVNLTGVFLMTKHCVPHLRKSAGAIVNIASTRALQSEPNTEAYAATKGGVVALTHALAMSLGPRIRVNCISPGWIAKAKLSRKDHAQHPVGRAGRPEDVGELVAFLISDRAGFITGQNFVADGGMTHKMIYL